jgi:DNA replication and repair protein RecF
VHVRTIELVDFRCYETARLELEAGVTAIVGDNGSGKTSLLEAVSWVATGKSFRGVPDAALVRDGAAVAIVRSEVASGERHQLVEAELHGSGRNRVLVNRNPVARVRDLLGVLRITVFAPDDLELVKGGPAGRRGYLDELLVSIAPRYEATRSDYDRVLRQRNALLRGRMHDAEALATLDVFDEQLARTGAELTHGRLHLVARLTPVVAEAYRSLAAHDDPVELQYVADWFSGEGRSRAELVTALHDALSARRRQERERGLTLVGPHRDELRLLVDAHEARTHTSQGEQRSLAVALRLSAHQVCIAVTGEEPVLLLDDVFSELDPQRSAALLRQLHAEQTLLTTASALPDGVHPGRVLRVNDGHLVWS